MTGTEVGRIIVGQVYRRHQLRKVLRGGVAVFLDVDLGLYRVEGFVGNGETQQELVSRYSAAGGPAPITSLTACRKTCGPGTSCPRSFTSSADIGPPSVTMKRT